MKLSRYFSTRLLAVVIVTGSTLAAVPTVGAPPAFAATSKNLVKNGNAEKGPASETEIVPVPGWTRTTGGSFTVGAYGGSFPATDAPGPKHRGANLFAGGPDDASNTIVASQTDSLKNYATAIAGGKVGFAFEGYFGGYYVQTDNATATIDFLGKQGVVVGSATIGGVTPGDRNNVTGLLLRSTTGAVPSGAKTVRVQLTFVREAGTYNDGYADNISLTLTGV